MWVEQERGSLPPAREGGGPASFATRWKRRRIAPSSERSDARAAAAEARAEGEPGAEDALGVAETARTLGVTRTAVYLALADGRLSGEKVGDGWRVDRQSVDAWIGRERSLFNRAAAARRRLRLAAPVATVLAFFSPTAVARAVAAIRSAPERFRSGRVTGRRAYAAGIAAALASAAIITVLTLSDGTEPQQQGGSEGPSSGPVQGVSRGDGDSPTAAVTKSGNHDERTVLAQSSARRARSDDGAGSAGGTTEIASGGSGGEVSQPAPSDPSPAPEGKPPPSGEAPSPAPPAPAAPLPQPPPSAGGTDPTAPPPPASETGVQPADGGTGGVETGVGG